MKRLYVSILLTLALCLTACGTDKSRETPENVPADPAALAPAETRPEEGFTLSEEGKAFLAGMCRTLNDFDSQTAKNDAFWKDFLFYSYTGAPEGVQTEQIHREDMGSDETVVKVSLEDAGAYAKLVFGVNLPDLKPSFEDMEEGQTSFYYQDGFYYIGVSDFPDCRYTFSGCEESGDSIAVSYVVDIEDESNVGMVTFTIVPADNENGFIITSKSQLTGDSDIHSVQ